MHPETALQLAARTPLTQHNRAATTKAYNVEQVLANIDANHGDVGVECVSPV
jgi:hypothetical protein